MYLENCIQILIRNIKTSEVIVIIIMINYMFETNELKKYLLPTHVTLYMCASIIPVMQACWLC